MQVPTPTTYEDQELLKTMRYPRISYMGSKYKVLPYLASILKRVSFDTALDAFSGSGVVSYALKEMGKAVTSNDFLNFSSIIAKSVIANNHVKLEPQDIEALTSPNRDGRDFVASTFQGLYFPQEDHEFIDAVWSHIVHMPEYKRELAISALCLAAARKQPRGVFTVTDLRYDDGRRSMHTPLKTLFLEAVEEYNQAVFSNDRPNAVTCSDILSYERVDFDLVYFDPPCAPPKDDADYIKRYHFLEGISVYWSGMEIMHHTKTKKIPKRFTPFAYKKTVRHALYELFSKFSRSTLVLSYSSNSVPNDKELYRILKEVKQDVQVFSVPHTYSFGTHDSALRRMVEEYIFVAR